MNLCCLIHPEHKCVYCGLTWCIDHFCKRGKLIARFLEEDKHLPPCKESNSHLTNKNWCNRDGHSTI